MTSSQQYNLKNVKQGIYLVKYRKFTNCLISDNTNNQKKQGIAKAIIMTVDSPTGTINILTQKQTVSWAYEDCHVMR